MAVLAWGGLYLLPAICLAGTFHVSPLGSNTPPYDTYAKAAHRIADAVALAASGDTVRIGAGTYPVDSTIVLKESFIAIQGAGRDSTVIVLGTDSNLRFGFYASGYDYSPDFGFEFSDMTIKQIPPHDAWDSPIFSFIWLDGLYNCPSVRETVVRRCRFVDGNDGIETVDCPLRVEECLFEDYQSYGITSWGLGPYLIRNNVFRADRVNTAIDFSPDAQGPITIDHNTVFGGYESVFLNANYCTDMVVANNYVDVGFIALWVSGERVDVVNNYIAGGIRPEDNPYDDPLSMVMWLRPESSPGITCENNTIIAHRPGYIRIFSPRGGSGNVAFQYNAMWGFQPDSVVPFWVLQGTPQDPGSVKFDTTGLIWTDPMLTPDSSGALLPGSPLINAGNPEILDADGSRSDIGLFGGPGGNFPYVDWRAPKTPEALRGEKSGDSFRLSWKANTEADLAGYRIYSDTTWGYFVLDRAARCILIPPESTSFRDTLLPRPMSDGWGYWFYKLVAVDTAGFRSPPTENLLYWRVDYPPAAPDSLRGVAVGNGFRLSWKPNTELDIAGYRVYSDTEAGFLINHANRVVAVPQSSTTFLDTIHLTPPGAAQFYKVTAVDEGGLESKASNEVQWSIVYRPLRAPDSLRGDTVREGFQLSWRPNTESYLAGYRVYSDTSAGFLVDRASRVDAIPRDSTTFLDTLRPVWGPRFYKVTASDSAGLESPPSDEVVWSPRTLPIALPRAPSILTAYPNPFNSTIVIEYGLPDAGAQPARVVIRIYNTLGQLVKTLYDGSRSPGRYEVLWDGRDSSGASASSGAYYVRLDYWGQQTKAYKIVLLK